MDAQTSPDSISSFCGHEAPPPSLSALLRGTGCETSVFGLRYQSCLAPCRISTQPKPSIVLKMHPLHDTTSSSTLRIPGI